MALTTRARVDVLTTLALFSTRETVAVDTLARRATCSRFMSLILYRKAQVLTVLARTGDSVYMAIRGYADGWLDLQHLLKKQKTKSTAQYLNSKPELSLDIFLAFQQTQTRSQKS